MCSHLNINFDYFRIQGVDKSLADIIRVRLEHQGAGKTVVPSLKRHFFRIHIIMTLSRYILHIVIVRSQQTTQSTIQIAVWNRIGGFPWNTSSICAFSSGHRKSVGRFFRCNETSEQKPFKSH